MKNVPHSDFSTNLVDYRLLGLSWFIKIYPDLSKIEKNDFEVVAFDVFDVCKNFIGTESTSARGEGLGGAHGEIRCAIAAAMSIAIEFDPDEVRHFNSGTIAALKTDWNNNDHYSFLTRCAGYERNATNSKIDLLPIVQEISESVLEMIDEEEEVEFRIDPVVAEFVSVIGEITSSKQFISGNRSRNRAHRKSVKMAVSSLFEEGAR